MTMRTIVSLLLLVFSISTAQHSYNKEKIDIRFWNELEQSILTGTTQQPSRLFKHALQGTAATDAIVYSSSVDDAEKFGVTPLARYSTFYTARLTAAQMISLSELQSTVYIEAPKMRYPKLDKSLLAMKVDKIHAGQVNSTVYKGKDVIIGIIDSGIDWKHPDFRKDNDSTKTRILFLWDQTDGRSSIGPTGFNYGAEYDTTEINNELDGSPAGFVQEADLSGHGTHVASTAAGDGSASAGKYTGVAPEADLIIVKAGDGGFSTTNIINGISYIRQKAVAAGKPFVINMSLGSHDGAHDGTAAEEVAVESELSSGSGRQIVIAAGNEGSDAIYGGGTLAAAASKIFTFTIPAYTAEGGSVNDYVYFSMWYKNGDTYTVSVKTPSNSTVSANTGVNQTSATANGFVHIANGVGTVNTKGGKECIIEIYDNSSAQPPSAGTWTITVTANSVPQGGSFDMWLAGSSITGNVAGDPVEFASGHSFSKLIGMPGTAENSITVGAYVTKWSWPALDGNTYSYVGTDRTDNFSSFSSMGPTRDGRQKPDISAPGQAIGAARSGNATFQSALLLTPAGKYVIEQGTSMAAPHVAGLTALMLEAKNDLTPAQIRTKINATAVKDGFTGGAASAQWGNGKVDAQAALQQVLSVSRTHTLVPQSLALEQNFPNPFNPATTISFSVPASGAVSLTVYSVLGEKVTTLVDERLASGTYSVPFSGSAISSGVYFYTLKTDAGALSRKMVLLK
ncbi:MAG: S8 family serine peptidase [Bacteroidota bacterium]